MILLGLLAFAVAFTSLLGALNDVPQHVQDREQAEYLNSIK